MPRRLRPSPTMTSASRTSSRSFERQEPGSCIVAIGASAGGLDALKEFLRLMPAGNRLAFVVIQHLDPAHESHAPELLARCTDMPVEQARNGIAIKPGRVYTNPPGKTLSVKAGHLRVSALKPTTRRLPIDHFFRALGDDQRQRAIGVVMSGSGADGAIGLRTIAAKGGLVIVQEPTTAQFDGMPRSAIQSGLVNAILPIARMPDALGNYARHPYVTQTKLPVVDDDTERAAFASILELLRERTRIDFTGYKRTMLDRRVQRRMGLRGITTLQRYAELLTDEAGEADALCKDLLIGVTGFFRDPAAWLTLGTHVIAPLARERKAGTPIRVWVAGSATGEEAYSIAILLTEHLEREGKGCPVQILATDASDDAIAVARAGVYPAGIAEQLSEDRLLRFFTELPGENRYKVRDELRACVVFARHDILHDPAYSKLDLVICRNLLIYLQAPQREKIIRLFHFGLNPNGCLFLGAAESLGRNEDRFKALSDKWRIFRRSGKAPSDLLDLARAPTRVCCLARGPFPTPHLVAGSDYAGAVQRRIIERFAPAARPEPTPSSRRCTSSGRPITTWLNRRSPDERSACPGVRASLATEAGYF
ncbi:MAG: chemotaxis protein CheB [Burkholderiaceae bacterium]